MNKEWAKKEVADDHDYTSCFKKNCRHHNAFGEWVSWYSHQYKNEQVSIFDLGCGNGNVVNYLPKFDKYVGIDINEAALNYAEENLPNHLKTSSNTKREDIFFFLQDIEGDIREKVLQEIKSCQICYVDSTITMLENPKKVLQEILIPNFEFIFLNRTKLTNKKKIKHHLGGKV